jgi:cyclase
MELGRSSVSLRIPVSGQSGDLRVWLWQNRHASGISMDELLESIPIEYVGEVVLTSVENNGTRMGHQTDVLEIIKKLAGVQKGYEGGVCSSSEVSSLWESGIDAVYASSFLFLYGGFDAPLLDYPTFEPTRYIS